MPRTGRDCKISDERNLGLAGSRWVRGSSRRVEWTPECLGRSRTDSPARGLPAIRANSHAVCTSQSGADGRSQLVVASHGDRFGVPGIDWTLLRVHRSPHQPGGRSRGRNTLTRTSIEGVTAPVSDTPSIDTVRLSGKSRFSRSSCAPKDLVGARVRPMVSISSILRASPDGGPRPLRCMPSRLAYLPPCYGGKSSWRAPMGFWLLS